MIANCGHDEHNEFHSGNAGDQTGKEWQIKPWYNGKWDVVLRYPDERVRDTLAKLAVEAARNDLIGYDQWQRQTYWEALQKTDYDPSKINTPCEADCSSGVCANIKAAGFLLDIKKLKYVYEYLRTAIMCRPLEEAGFMALTDKRYLTSDKYLLKGDILLRIGHHVTTNITNGVMTDYVNEEELDMPLIKKGSKGKAVKIWQVIIDVRTDGIFGDETLEATKRFQKENDLEVDGIVGPKTWKAGLDKI